MREMRPVTFLTLAWWLPGISIIYHLPQSSTPKYLSRWATISSSKSWGTRRGKSLRPIKEKEAKRLRVQCQNICFFVRVCCYTPSFFRLVMYTCTLLLENGLPKCSPHTSQVSKAVRRQDRTFSPVSTVVTKYLKFFWGGPWRQYTTLLQSKACH